VSESNPKTTLYPLDIKLQKRSRRLLIEFSNGKNFSLSAEYLRVYSPSAEVRGHGQKEPTLVFHKQNVNIDSIEIVGRYAVRLIFDDGHDTGIYSWSLLYELGSHKNANWKRYLERTEEAGHLRNSEPNDG
tara:strand:+ start:159 stop:551 length:393 start_codon:yes stop_codon:yes gene_type:complete